jgi:ubiquinone/menaquinone biosynthesis C-methylase UbiE
VNRDERAWQDARGGHLQADAYGRAGTRVVLEEQFARIAAALAPAPGQRLLDVGCGVGHLLAWLAGRGGGRHHGLDLSTASVGAARAACPSAGFAVGDAERLPYRSGAFDRIVYNGSAHHLPDLAAALVEAHRVLAPGGRIVLFEPVSSRFTNTVRRLFGDDAAESPADLAHKHDVDPGEVATALRAAGFTAVASDYSDALAYPLSGMYTALPMSRAPRLMDALVRLERRLWRASPIRPLLATVAWRLLAVGVKEPAEPGA